MTDKEIIKALKQTLSRFSELSEEKKQVLKKAGKENCQILDIEGEWSAALSEREFEGCFRYRLRPNYTAPDPEVVDDKGKIIAIQELITSWGGIDGSHHKQWLLDEIVQVITGDGYDTWVTAYNNGTEGPNTYEWDKGISP